MFKFMLDTRAFPGALLIGSLEREEKNISDVTENLDVVTTKGKTTGKSMALTEYFDTDSI